MTVINARYISNVIAVRTTGAQGESPAITDPNASVCLPVGLPYEAGEPVLELLNKFTEAFERQYLAQLHRYYNARNERDGAANSRQHDLRF